MFYDTKTNKTVPLLSTPNQKISLDYSNNYINNDGSKNRIINASTSIETQNKNVSYLQSKKGIIENVGLLQFFKYKFNKNVMYMKRKAEDYRYIRQAELSIENYYEYEYYTKMIYEIQILIKFTFRDEPSLLLLMDYYKKANMWNTKEMEDLYEFGLNSKEKISKLKDLLKSDSNVDSLKKNGTYFMNIINNNIKENLFSNNPPDNKVCK